MNAVKKVMIVFGMVILVGGCGKNNNEESQRKEGARRSEKKSIIGKWQEVDATQTIEFFKDGTVRIVDKGEPSISGDYEFIDESKIKMEFTGIGALFGAVIAEISPTGDEFTLSNPFGEVEKYQKLEEGEGKSWESDKTPLEKVVSEKKTPALKIAFSRGVFQIGDFSVGLSLMRREVRETNLLFVIRKVKKPGSEIRPLAITLTDDHQNKYYGTLEIIPHDNFPLHLLPVDFSYAKKASIVMPQLAPIETIQLENSPEIAFKKLKLVEPQFKVDSGPALLLPGKPILVGKYLLFTVDRITPDLYTWALELTIENKEYNGLKAAIWYWAQFNDGRITSIENPVIQEIDGLSKRKVYLPLQFLQSQEISKPLTILLIYQDCSSGQTILKLFPISVKDLPPRVGQGTEEEIFIEAYQRSGGPQVIGNPLNLPHWYARGSQPKDEHDLVIQEFPKSLIVWDKQKYASKAYVLQGATLEKYRELGGPYYRSKFQETLFLGAPTSDLETSKSSFGTAGSFTAFKGGVIFLRGNQTFLVMGKIGEKWNEQSEQLGFPISEEKYITSGAQGSDTTGWVQEFEGGCICYVTKGEQAGRTFELHGPVAKAYSEIKDSSSWLGFPVTEVYKSLGSKPADQADFGGGYIGTRDGKKWEAFPYETGQIVFVSNRDGNPEIYVMDANGKNQLNLTNNPANDWDPVWSPDGEKIAFVSNRDGNPEIYVMDADGTNATRLTNNDVNDINPAWFPDGTKLVFVSSSVSTSMVPNGHPWDRKPPILRREVLPGIFAMDVDGTNQRLLWTSVKDVINRGRGVEPTVSPDGRKIAFATVFSAIFSPKLWVINSDGTNEVCINNSMEKLFWSPLGNKIIFQYTGNIGLINPEGGEPNWILNSSSNRDVYAKDFCISPNGKKIAFSSHQGEIYIMDINGSLGRRITRDTDGENWDPSWTAGTKERKSEAVPIKETIPTHETIPVEKVIPVEKTIPDTEISEAGIPGRYILEEVDSQGKVLGREPGIMTFQEDGRIIGSYSGRWLVQGEQINFSEGSKKVGSGKLLAGAIVNWQVDDVPSWQAEKILKKEGAEMLRKGPEWIVVWSDYFSPGNQSFSLKLQKDANFSMSGLLEEQWKIENRLVQVYKAGQKTDFSDGRIEGDNIVFKFGDGFVKLTKQK